MKIIKIGSNNDGVEAIVEHENKTYEVYLQLPLCGDSQNSFLDNTGDNDKDSDLLYEIAKFVDSQYSDLDLNFLTFVGYVPEYENFTFVNGFEYYVTFENDSKSRVLKEHGYSSYYNKLLLEEVDESRIEQDYHEDADALIAKIKEIRDRETTN